MLENFGNSSSGADNEKSPELCQNPNKHAPPLQIEFFDDIARFSGYQQFVLTRHSLNAGVEDTSLRRKQDLLNAYFLPRYLSQRTVLDLGANSGFFSFWALQNAATKSIALDIDEDYLKAMEEVRAKLGFENLQIVNGNFIDWEQPADVVLALALIHWIYSCTAISGSLDHAVQHLTRLTKYFLIVEWIDPDDPAIDFFHHLDWNKESNQGPYNLEAFEAALGRSFARYEMIGEVSPTRRLYIAFRTDHEIDLSGPLPFVRNRDTLIQSRFLTRHDGVDYWSRVYDDEDGIVKQATLNLAHRESYFLSQLDSPYFPRVLGSSNEDDYSLIVLEKIQGVPLSRSTSYSSLIGLHSFTQHCLNLLEELESKGIVHRDIRPENILVRNSSPVLIDFGWAISEGHPCFTPEGLGTIGRPSDSSFSDVYSMGRVLEEIHSHRFDLFDRVLELMVAPDPSLRITDLNVLRMLFAEAFELTTNSQSGQTTTRIEAQGQPVPEVRRVAIEQLLHKTFIQSRRLVFLQTDHQLLTEQLAEKGQSLEEMTRRLVETERVLRARDEAVGFLSQEDEQKVKVIAQRDLAIEWLQDKLKDYQKQVKRLAAATESLRNDASQTSDQLKARQDLLAETREKLRLYSLKLSQLTVNLSATRTQNSELEAQLSSHVEERKKLRGRVSDGKVGSRWSLGLHAENHREPIVGSQSSQSAPIQPRRTLREQFKDVFRSPLTSQQVPTEDAFEHLSGEQKLIGVATLTAYPEEVVVGTAPGVTELFWDSGDDSEVQLYVSVDGKPEELFVNGVRGSSQASWIYAGSSYKFCLYAGTDHERLLQSVVVTGVRIPSKSRDALRCFLDPPLQRLGASSYLEVSGWAYSKEARIIWVEAFAGNVPLGLMNYGEPRADLPTDSASAVSIDCGFSGKFLLDESLVAAPTLRVRVADECGNIQDFEATILRPLMSEVIEVGEPRSLLDTLSSSRESLVARARISLASFLASNSTIEFPSPRTPEVSIIVVLYNRAELTLECLSSILRSNTDSYELIIVDNASTDETPRLLNQIRGARIIQNETNLHFLRACNQAAKKANGKHLLFLNNDAQLVAGSVSAALQTINSSDEIGAVGGKIILPDGTLQEAGSIIWQDGSCLGYGRGDSPFAPAYMYKRDVDYCSGAFLLTKRELFLEGDGFDEDYSPAYYEETDYCVRLWKNGKRVVYDPKVIIFHHEFASSSSQSNAIELQIKHHKVFLNKHRKWLEAQPAGSPANMLSARSHQRNQRRILFLDDTVPHINLGSGFPRSNRILAELVKLGHTVTFYPTNCPHENWCDVYRDVPAEVEVMLDHGWPKLREFLTNRSEYYDLIFISRPHNMASFKSLLTEAPNICGRARLIYDAEALFSYREIEQKRLEGNELSAGEQAKLINDEISLAENCDRIVSVSDRERREFSTYGFKSVYTLGHAVEIAPTTNNFEDRKGILFVGPIHAATSPNADSMVWFIEEIFPLIRERLGEDLKLTIAGLSYPEFRERYNKGPVHLAGQVDDLTPLYDQARLFVAPTRFCAGIPLKICEAAAHGLPAVATSLIGLQLEWEDERDLLLANDARSFADACIRLYQDRKLWGHLRDNMIKRVRKDFAPQAFAERLKLIIQ